MGRQLVCTPPPNHSSDGSDPTPLLSAYADRDDDARAAARDQLLKPNVDAGNAALALHEATLVPYKNTAERGKVWAPLFESARAHGWSLTRADRDWAGELGKDQPGAFNDQGRRSFVKGRPGKPVTADTPSGLRLDRRDWAKIPDGASNTESQALHLAASLKFHQTFGDICVVTGYPTDVENGIHLECDRFVRYSSRCYRIVP